MSFVIRAGEVSLLGAIIGAIVAGVTGLMVGAALGLAVGALSVAEARSWPLARQRRGR